jgi:hypothetical protein
VGNNEWKPYEATGDWKNNGLVKFGGNPGKKMGQLVLVGSPLGNVAQRINNPRVGPPPQKMFFWPQEAGIHRLNMLNVLNPMINHTILDHSRYGGIMYIPPGVNKPQTGG